MRRIVGKFASCQSLFKADPANPDQKYDLTKDVVAQILRQCKLQLKASILGLCLDETFELSKPLIPILGIC